VCGGGGWGGGGENNPPPPQKKKTLFVSRETVKVWKDCHFAFRSVKFNSIISSGCNYTNSVEVSAFSASIITKPSSKFIPKEEHKNKRLKSKNSIIFFSKRFSATKQNPKGETQTHNKASSNSFKKKKKERGK
jgi:hypothetical protein